MEFGDTCEPTFPGLAISVSSKIVDVATDDGDDGAVGADFSSGTDEDANEATRKRIRLRRRRAMSSSSADEAEKMREHSGKGVVYTIDPPLFVETRERHTNHRGTSSTATTPFGDLMPLPNSDPTSTGAFPLGNSEWAPGLVTRTLIIGLGYVVGTRVYESATGLGTITSLVLIIICNEFFSFSLKCVRVLLTRERRGDDDDSVSEMLRVAERVSVILRYFAFTAVTYAANESFKKLFGDVDESIGIVIMLIFIIVFNEALESMFSDGRRSSNRVRGGKEIDRRRDELR